MRLLSELPCEDKGWFQVPNAFVDRQLAEVRSHGELSVLLALTRFADKDGIAWPSLSYLAKATGLNRSSVTRSIKSLITASLVERTAPGDRVRSTRYRVCLDEPARRCTDAPRRTSALGAHTHACRCTDAPQHKTNTNTITVEEYKERPEMNEITWSADNGFSISTAAAEEIKKSFPAVDVPTELNRMNAWLKANPLKARKKNWRRFITNWLLRSNENNGNNFQPKATGTTGAASRFAGRHQRDRDLSL